MDKVKIAVAILVSAGALGGFYYFEDQSLLLRVIGLLVAFGLSIAIMLQTAIGRSAWGFIKDSQIEIRKVIWPTPKETGQTTLIVMAMVVVIALFLWVLDGALIWGVRILTGQGV